MKFTTQEASTSARADEQLAVRRSLRLPKDSKLEVTFGSLRIHEHAVTVGVEEVSRGTPLKIQWKAFNTFEVDIDKYEELRPPRRSSSTMIIPPQERERLLKAHGHSNAEILLGTKRSNVLRRKRRRSVQLASRDHRMDKFFGR